MRFWIDEPAMDYALTSTKPVRHSPCGTAKRADEDTQYHCDGCTSPDGRHCEPFPCPTRRLTAEIRGEMSND